MDNMFADLEQLGLGGIGSVSLFEEEKEEVANQSTKGKEDDEVAKSVHNEEDFIFDKTMTCPVCDKSFKTKQVKTGKPRFVGTDTDLRPRYDGIDVVKYDVAVCLHCGYASLIRNFSNITPRQCKDIKENITSDFKGMTNDLGAYSYDTAIQRYKLALFSGVVKHAKLSDRAYICLKLAWLYRGYRENLSKETKEYDKVAKSFAINELSFTKNAYEGFTKALAKEMPPICNMDDSTVNYMMSDLARKCQDYGNAEKYVYAVISSRSANSKVKERARTQLALIKKEKERFEGKSN